MRRSKIWRGRLSTKSISCLVTEGADDEGSFRNRLDQHQRFPFLGKAATQPASVLPPYQLRRRWLFSAAEPSDGKRCARGREPDRHGKKRHFRSDESGGPSHSDTFDLKEGAWTPSFMAPTSYGDIRWPQGIMPKLGEQMDNIALVRSVRSWAAVHELARTWIQIGEIRYRDWRRLRRISDRSFRSNWDPAEAPRCRPLYR